MPMTRFARLRAAYAACRLRRRDDFNETQKRAETADLSQI